MQTTLINATFTRVIDLLEECFTPAFGVVLYQQYLNKRILLLSFKEDYLITPLYIQIQLVLNKNKNVNDLLITLSKTIFVTGQRDESMTLGRSAYSFSISLLAEESQLQNNLNDMKIVLRYFVYTLLKGEVHNEGEFEFRSKSDFVTYLKRRKNKPK